LAYNDANIFCFYATENPCGLSNLRACSLKGPSCGSSCGSRSPARRQELPWPSTSKCNLRRALKRSAAGSRRLLQQHPRHLSLSRSGSVLTILWPGVVTTSPGRKRSDVEFQQQGNSKEHAHSYSHWQCVRTRQTRPFAGAGIRACEQMNGSRVPRCTCRNENVRNSFPQECGSRFQELVPSVTDDWAVTTVGQDP
jgi:hypothetical protein